MQTQRYRFSFGSLIGLVGLMVLPSTTLLTTEAIAHPRLTIVQLTSTTGCLKNLGGSFASFDATQRRVAFISSCDLVRGRNTDGNHELFVMNVDGTDLVQLTSSTGGAGVINPKISLDGHKIVFSSDRSLVPLGNTDGNFELFVIHANGRGLTQLTKTTGGNLPCGFPGNSHPQFDPTDRRIIFGSDRDLTGGNPDGNSEVFVMEQDGSGIRQLTHTTGGCGCDEGNLDITNTKVLFSSDRDLVSGKNSDENYELFTMNIDGTNIHQLTNTVTPTGVGSVAPRWTSDTKTIVFRSDGPAGNFQVFRMKGDGTRMVQITHNPGGFGSAPWCISPDGATIAVHSDRDLVPGSNSDLSTQIFLIHLGRGLPSWSDWADESD